MKKIGIVIIALLITGVINYVLFVPSSSVNLMLGLFISYNRTFMLLSDLAISNLVFWAVLEVLFLIDKNRIAEKA